MSTLKPGTEIMTRIVLTAVILLNALVPTASVAQAATESTAAVPAKLAPAERENSSIRTFKRPEARVADHVSDISSFPTNSSSQADQAIKKNNASPLMFIENIGQFDPRALFVAQGSDTNIYLSQNELWFTVAEKIKKEKPAQDPLNKPKKIKVVNLKMIFPGSNSEPEIQPFDKLDVRVSRFIGNDPSKYSTNIPVWNGIRYADLYPGADLELTSENGMFVWRIVVKDSVRFSQDTYIRSHGLSMKIAGQKQLALDNGKLKIKTDLGDYNLPQVQVTGTIDSKVFSLAPKVVGDELLLIYPKGLSFDSNHGGLGVLASLAIEQTNRNSLIQLQEEISSNISFLILIGGGDYDDAWGQAVGPDGSMFVTGETESTDYFPNFPGYDGSYNGLSDAFVVKINPDGDVMYATYVGGSEREFGMAIAVNKQGEAYVAGGIASMDFPLAGNPISTVGRAGFLIKLNESGDQLLYSSFVGSINEYIISMRIDAQENVYMLEGGLGNQGIVYKLKPGDNHYIYPPHTLAAGNWFSIAVDANGNAFLTGSTSDPNSNVLATKLNNAGSTVYSRSFGGNGADGGWGIAVDENGYAYITGDTTSPDFPLEGSPLTGRQSLTAYDAFVTILDPDGVIWYSSYLDMSADIDQGIGIAVDSYGSIYISGNTSDGIDYWSVFVVRLTPSNPAEGYKIGSIDLIGDSMIYGGIGTVDGHGNVYVAGSEWDVNYNYDAFLAVVSTWPTVPDISIVSSCTEDSCIAPVADTQSFVGGPINTRTGNYEYSREDISIMTSAGSLAFTRDYSSSNIGLATPLSPGWTHNHDIRLTFPTAPEGQSGKVLFKAHTANKYIFTINDDGTYSAYPGLTATLVNNQGSYVLKDSSQNTYTFDSSGKLQLYADAQGHTWNYVYDSTSGKLIRINPDGSTHYLSLHYDPQGRIDSVSDRTVPTGQIERSVTYQYGSNGDLDDVSDVLGHHWTYEYTNHLLTRVAAPGDVAVERTDYDSEGRAWRQFGPDADGDGQDDLVIELTYNVDGTTTLKDRVNDPDPEIHTYDERGTLISDQDGMGGMQKKDYDFNFRPGIITDALKNTTTLNWSDNGANLTYIKDALNGETSIEYENPDSPNSPTKITDPLDYVTTYSYDTHFPSLPTRIEYPLSFDNGISYIGTDYEYYQPNNSEDQPAGKLHIATDALGHKAHYTYTSSGQPDVVITAYQTAAAQTTDYDYDDLGRPVRVIDPSGVITRNKYDAAGQLIVTINNVNPSTPDAEDPPQNLASGNNIYNLYTRYAYDARGNQIAVTDTNGIITRTYYDLANRPVTVVQNLVGQTIDVTSPPERGSGAPDENIRTDTEYDEAGNAIATTDPAGTITRTYYDAANRPSLMIQNYAGTGVYDPANPDQNIRTEYTYDLNGNLIGTKDTLGVITRTYYDQLNRPATVVQHLTGQDISVETPPARGTDSNIRTDTYYDANGNMIATVDPKEVITRTYYDALNRPVTVVQNLVGQNVANTMPPDRDEDALTASISTNMRTDTWYDQAGNVVATRDQRGVWARTYYDEANRPVAALQNWTGSDLYGDITTAPAYNPAYPDENIRSVIAYNSDGRRDTTTDPLGRQTKYEYNDVGELIKTFVNYVNEGDPQDNEHNIVTEYAYDALGRQVSTTDALGRVTLNSYDDLGRLLSTTQNYLEGQPQQDFKDSSGDRYNIITTYAYDSRGNQLAVTTKADTDKPDVVTRTYYDALSRPVTVVRNFIGDISNPTPPERGNSLTNLRTDTVYLGNGSVDYVLDELGKKTNYNYDDLGRLITTLDPLLNPTTFEYDADGKRTLMTTFKTEALPTSTKYEYDNLNRLTAVVENYRDGVAPDSEKNIRTTYTYDASGNRLSIRDGYSNLEGNAYKTIFTYDAFGRLKTETDPLGNPTSYRYDAMGNLVRQTDALGQRTCLYYDDLNRLKGKLYRSDDDCPVNPTVDTYAVSFNYDELGRRQSMDDDLGTTGWEYNNLDLPKHITDPFGTQVSYDYDALGNRTNLSYGDQAFVYKYDAVDRLSEVTGSGLPNKVEYAYYASGRLKTVTRPNGVDTDYHYYDNGWLQDIIHSAGATTLASYEYDYYDNGNRHHVTENVQNPQLVLNPSGVLAGANMQPLASTQSSSNIRSVGTTGANYISAPEKALYNTKPQQMDLDRLPLSFIANVGQFDKDVKFQTNSLGGSIYFTPSEVVLVLMDKKIKLKSTEDDLPVSSIDNSKLTRLEYKNTKKDPRIEGYDLQTGVANFMIGSDKKSWVADAPMYGGVIYYDLYPGIDLKYEGTGQSLKSTFLVAAGADPALIQWQYKDAENTNLDANGNLLITLPAKKTGQTETTLVEHTPRAWQEQDGQQVQVAVQYVVSEKGEAGFVFPQGYDASLPLTIDPTLTYGTYLGGIGTDVGTTLTADASGNVYVTGYSWCGYFPITDPIGEIDGSTEAIISKISPDGSTLLYSTCVGGSGSDRGLSIDLDTNGRVVIGGDTNSADFPIVSGIATYGGDTGICSVDAPCQDNFILVLNEAGSAIRYSTYLGGNGREEFGALAVDGDGKIIVAGSTTSTNFPTMNAYDNSYATGGTCSSSTPCYDATVTRIDPDLMGTNAILYSTYLGGTVIDQVFGMTLDSGGKLYLVGRSSSDDYPTRSALQAARKGAYDVIVAQIDPSLSGDASLLYSTYFGTTVTDIGYAIARDSDGNLYLTGRTYSGRFPLRDPLQYVSHSGTCGASSCYEAFVTKLKIATNELVYSTYLGGSQNDEGHGIAVDAYGRAYVTGYTRSSDFPVYNAIQSTKGPDSCAAPPCADAFLSVLEPNGQAFAYSTFLGGDQDDIANGITLDADNNVYLVGETYSTNFPTTPGAYDVINTETNKRDVFIARVTPLGAAPEQTTNHLDLAVAAGSDDAEQSASGSVSLTSSDLELVRDSNNQTVGVRFTGVSVPQGATIVNASLQFAVDETTSEATSLTIQAEASDNAATFAATSNNISGRPRTSASATWTPAAWNTVDQAGPDQRTPDLATVIQEVVNRSGWTAGNAMAIILTGTGKRVAKSYEEDALAGAPYLHIEYTLPGQLDLQITANPTSFTSAGQTITYTYTLTNTGTVALTGPYGVSDDKVSSVDCSAAQSPLGVGASTTCAGSYTTTPADVTAGSVTDTATATASAGVQNVTSNTATATVTLQIPSGPVTITYDYDLLNRLTGAEYSTGDTYTYTYDAVGNRLTQDSTMGGLSSTVSYGYDAAHQRMTSVNGVTYDWDANGNLRSDGVKTYTYDAANRLVAVSGQQFPVSYSYNGLGDRLQETVDGQTTTFTMDYNTGLTQALSDGTNSYIYGVDRIAQVNSGAEYFLGDALGSVRQLTNANGTITYARAYDPYGVVTSSYGSSQSAYGYTNEYTDSYIKLIYLRSRLYDPLTGRFTTKDTWQGDYNRPTSYNAWLYAYANPINLSDPSGLNPNCIHPYLSFCAFQRFTEILEENSTNGATALVNLFTDNELENMWGRYAGTTSAARLEWILGITFGSTNPVENLLVSFSRVSPFPRLNFNLQFGVLFPNNCAIDPTNQNCGCGIASELEDSGFYINAWHINPLVTNQINHFLSGVGEYYYGKDLTTIIAHEKSTDATAVSGWMKKAGTIWQNYTNEVTPADISHFYRAWHFDTNGMYHERDLELWPILEFKGIDFNENYVDPARVGNSLQDLRLSLKAVRFADWVISNRSSNPSKAGDWLTINLFP